MIDPALAAQLAPLLRHLADECDRIAGTSKTPLALLGSGDAECRERADERNDTMLTASDVAGLIRVELRTLRRYRADPQMDFPKAIGRGRLQRWRRRDVEAWLERNKS
jgi:hypothetical protein